MDTIDLQRLAELDQLKGSALLKQLDDIIQFIALATPWQIFKLEMTLGYYRGQHKRYLYEIIYKRKGKFTSSEKYGHSFQNQLARKRKERQRKERQRKKNKSQIGQNKQSSCKESISKFLNKFYLWRLLGFGRSQDKKEELTKNHQEQLQVSQQTQPAKNHQQSINLEKEVQERSAEKDTNGNQYQKQTSLKMSQQEDWQPYLCVQQGSEDALEKKDIGAKQEKSVKDQ